ncbi:ATP-binding cassette transporter snq2 [Coemansia sp. RSA 2705]|nr:ATP-binding cassette transporter snq2 [Coemansia sp. RSA 2705]
MRGLLVDQLGAVDIVCLGTNLVPSGPGFDNIAHQVCTLAGALLSQLIVRGADYLLQSMQVYVEDKLWQYYVVVVGSWLLFVALSAVTSEYIEYDIMAGSAIVSKHQKTEVEPPTEDLVSDRASSAPAIEYGVSALERDPGLHVCPKPQLLRQ